MKRIGAWILGCLMRNVKIRKEDIVSIVYCVDVDDDGYIDVPEFVEWLKRK